MSILMPALVRVREQAKEVICQSNLKQWSLLFSMYTNAHDGFFSGGWDGFGTWMEALKGYYGDEGDIFCCPAAMKPLSEGAPFGPLSAWGVFKYGLEGLYSAGQYGSYGINDWCYNDPPELESLNHWRNINVKGRTNIIPIFADESMFEGKPFDFDEPPEHPSDTLGEMGTGGGHEMKRFCLNRHKGYINCLFMDFSVRNVGLKELWKLKWHKGFDLNGPWTTEGGVTPSDWPTWMKEFKDY
ncbi:MAG: hypothetical protein MUO22_06355 [Sedimentisphaerales bacterium]|nr:hypothetical protein [Sedimentisphaerales bacterium]